MQALHRKETEKQKKKSAETHMLLRERPTQPINIRRKSFLSRHVFKKSSIFDLEYHHSSILPSIPFDHILKAVFQIDSGPKLLRAV
jgi:hypothetical protein